MEASGQKAQKPDSIPGPYLLDGGDRACGELLLVLAAQARRLPPRTRIRLLASDPAAPLDLPAWCHLTGHGYLGRGTDITGHAYYDIETVAQAVPTNQTHPWRPESRGST